ncbi:hypothetical protein IV203_004174 [Nitzschia inconspicua]|uniref:Uncharacterized protein n=1 Tax=Nitzschia inconspicua TaxID=303405 RepID=A0A9K3L338_9STRA|nr:hypothetical protein IV203_004174 [Nitzschia inconspicua]
MSFNKDRDPFTPPNSPPCHKDRLFQDLAKFSRSNHATQLLPKPGEFNLGQGDPLMEAAVENWKRQALENSHRQLAVDNLEVEDKGSFRRQHRHSRTKQRSLPDMSSFQVQKREKEIHHEVDHLEEHGSPFAGMGMNDVVHLKDGTVLSVPCVSPEILRQVTSQQQKRRHRNQRRHSMPNLFGRRKHSPPHHQQQQQPHDSKDDHPHSPPKNLRMSKLLEIGKHIGHGTLLPLR